MSHLPNFTKFEHNRSFAMNPFGREFWTFPRQGSFFDKTLKIWLVQRLATSGRHNSAMIIDRLKCITKRSLYETSSFHFLHGEEASPSIGNTLWRVPTMFTRSAITPPKVNGFGWNLGYSELIVWSWLWQTLGAIRAEARAGELAKILFFWSLK